jgi:hypothetical protein
VASGVPRILNELIAFLPEAGRAQIEARTWDCVAEEMALQDLRKAIGYDSKAIARELKVRWHAVSDISTLCSVLQATGGTLELIARFAGRPPV